MGWWRKKSSMQMGFIVIDKMFAIAYNYSEDCDDEKRD